MLFSFYSVTSIFSKSFIPLNKILLCLLGAKPYRVASRNESEAIIGLAEMTWDRRPDHLD
jgi:hypothetical protein